MRTSDFDYELPEELIAQEPNPRGSSRLLVVDRRSGQVDHSEVAALPELLDPGDVMILNNTRVIPARLYAHRPTGRRFEFLLLRRFDGDRWVTLLRPAARARIDEVLELGDGGLAVPESRMSAGQWLVRFSPNLDEKRLQRLGETPLPPYIRRPAGPRSADRERYQTIYASVPGAVAAPTAGLHFTEALLDQIADRGVEIVRLTLHVGIGTFKPVAVERVEEHRMHSEHYDLGEEAAARINRALETRKRIVCVGTTTVRALEGALAAADGPLRPGWTQTDLFITPGFRFRGTGAMLTNFHLPRSTLLMMVSAFAGREEILAAYRQAIRRRYRFFSYGDAMFIK